MSNLKEYQKTTIKVQTELRERKPYLFTLRFLDNSPANYSLLVSIRAIDRTKITRESFISKDTKSISRYMINRMAIKMLGDIEQEVLNRYIDTKDTDFR